MIPTGQARVALEAVADYAQLCEATARRFDAVGNVAVAEQLRAQARGARLAARRAISDLKIKATS